MPFNENGLYVADEQFFVNTREFTRTAQQFIKNDGLYTKLHPKWDKAEYKQFWDEEERKCRFGYSVGGVAITGEHYSWLNFGQIKRTTDTEDIEVIDGTGKFKSARKVGDKDIMFPDFWDGHYHWFNARKQARKLGKNLIAGKARRKGFSYIGGWSGAYNYNFMPSKTTLFGAFDKKYLTKGDGVFRIAKNYIDFLNKHTSWAKDRLVNQVDWVKSGYKDDHGNESGFKSEILAVSFQDNPDAAIGKDAYEVLLEECGKFPNLSEVLDVTIPALEEGTIKTGFLVAWGTGGTKDANWEAFEYQFYNPHDNDFLAFENIWDEGSQGTACGFFFPHSQNLTPYIDSNGNSLLDEAKADTAERRAWKKSNTTPDKFLLYTGQRAENPKEAFSQSNANSFMTAELALHVKKIQTDPTIKSLYRAGQLLRDDLGRIRLVPNEELESLNMDWHPPIQNYPPKKGQDLTGCFVEYYPRYINPLNGKVPKGLYRIWHDPFALSKDKDFIKKGDSLGATYIYEVANLFTPGKGDMLVGAYVGRTGQTDEYNSNLLKICEYYGGYENMLMFENDRGDVKSYFERFYKYHWLADEPEVLYTKQLTLNNTGRSKGISMYDDKRKAAAALYGYNWMYTIRGRDTYGNPRYNFQYIYDLGLLQELEKWNLKGNFDRVSSILVGMFDREVQLQNDVMKLPPPKKKNTYFNRKLY